MTFYYAESPSASYYFTKTHLSRGPGFMDARYPLARKGLSLCGRRVYVDGPVNPESGIPGPDVMCRTCASRYHITTSYTLTFTIRHDPDYNPADHFVWYFTDDAPEPVIIAIEEEWK